MRMQLFALLTVLSMNALTFEGSSILGQDSVWKDTDFQAKILQESSNATSQKSAKTPANFSILFSYGNGGHNVLNTSKGIFTKDLVEGDSTILFNLPSTQLDSIYSMMMKIGFFGYPSSWKEADYRSHRCWKHFDMRVQADSITKVIKSFPCDGPFEERSKSLERLHTLIIKFIESSIEYKKLPKTRAGYL